MSSPQNLSATTVTVKPEEMTKLIVGTFTSSQPEPQFDVALSPNQPDMIGVSLKKVNKGRTTTLVYHFQNFSDVPCNVTVNRR